MRSLKGLTIVMMGATGGMGTATALQLASPGVNIAFCSSNEEKVSVLKKKLADTGATVFGAVVDVTDCEQINLFMNSVYEKFELFGAVPVHAGHPCLPAGAGRAGCRPTGPTV